jgi:hypothetical protein
VLLEAETVIKKFKARKIVIIFVGFEVLTVAVKSYLFWDILLCKVVEVG